MKNTLIILGFTLFLCSCGGEQARQAKGFGLPHGDIKRGELAFAELGCNRCHPSVADVSIPESAGGSPLDYALGGEVRKVKSYGQLVTSIIKPQHVIEPNYLQTLEKEKRAEATSPMPNFNEDMKVSQLIDIVTFLHSHYKKLEPDYIDDYYYMP